MNVTNQNGIITRLSDFSFRELERKIRRKETQDGGKRKKNAKRISGENLLIKNKVKK